jgi:two-component system phosphate regulon response regulator PhoB
MRKVIFIEPDLVMGRIYEKAFKKKDYKVFIFTSAEEAIKFIDDTVPDLIVMEIQLHGHSGVELIHELRSYSDLYNVPIILNTLVTEQALRLTKQSMKSNKILRYFYKPETSLEKLTSYIEEALVVNET